MTQSALELGTHSTENTGFAYTQFTASRYTVHCPSKMHLHYVSTSILLFFPHCQAGHQLCRCNLQRHLFQKHVTKILYRLICLPFCQLSIQRLTRHRLIWVSTSFPQAQPCVFNDSPVIHFDRSCGCTQHPGQGGRSVKMAHVSVTTE